MMAISSAMLRGFIVVGLVAVTALVPLGTQAEEADLVPHGSDYLFNVYPVDGYPADWASAQFDEDGLVVGTAPFGSGLPTGCPLQATVRTFWPTPSVLLARRTFDLPLGATGVRVLIGIDNDFRVAINGNELGSDWTVHEGCPQLDEFVLDVPSGFLQTGSNLLSVLGRERHEESFLEVRVTAELSGSNQDPDCSSVTATPPSLKPADHTLRLAALQGATDPDGDPVQLTVESVTQDEPTSGLGRRDLSPDAAAAAGSDEVYLRAERDFAGDGRVYRIAFTGSDARGGTCAGSASVIVPRSRGIAIDSGQTYDSFAT